MAFSLIWALLSIALVVVGYLHCRSHAYNYTLSCQASQCEWKTTNDTIPVVSFPKADLLDAEVVRVDANGLYAETSSMKDNKSKYGYSVRLKLRLPLEPGAKLKTDKHLMFAPYDLGRRVSKSAVTSIRSFMDNAEQDSFRYSKGRMITALGIICIFVGLISLVLSCLFGQWMEMSPKRMKKSS